MNIDVIPENMRQARRWLLWRSEGEGRKVPYYVNGARRMGTLDSDEDRKRLADLSTALHIYGTNQFSGLGFALGPDENGRFWQGIDLDHVPDNPTLQELAPTLPGYVETSPSGTGLHAIGYGREFRTLGSNRSGIEAYCKGRYFTVTGRVIRNGELADLAGYVETTLSPLHSPDRSDERSPPESGDSFFAKVNTKALAQLHAWVPVLFPIAKPYHGGYRISSKSLGRGLQEDISILPIGIRDFGEERGATPIDLVVEWGPSGTPKDAAQWLCRMMGVDPTALGWNEQKPPPESKEENDESWPPTISDLEITDMELNDAKLAPRCIVEHYLYADVAQIVAPGGTGKTTMLLYEAICIALGLPLWGLSILAPGWTLIVTKEDRRERLVARIREIMRAMELDEDQRATVRKKILILDVSGSDRKLTMVQDGNIRRTLLAAKIVEAYRSTPPAVVVFDPMVSFGASEQAVNDNEQALIDVARYFVKEFDCCFRYVHHTGKSNAREKTMDQYSGRGGSAMSDGSRMTTVLAVWSKEDKEPLPETCRPEPADSVVRLVRAKLSYSPPNLPIIWVHRSGFHFSHHVGVRLSAEQDEAAKLDQIERFLVSQLNLDEEHRRFHSVRSLSAAHAILGITRDRIRELVEVLRACNRVYDIPLPSLYRRGRRQTFLCPRQLLDRFS